MSEAYYEDCEVRSWALDHAIQSNHRGAGADKIIKDAEKFYGFMFRNNGSVADINDLKASRAVPQPVEENAQDVFIPPAPVTPEDVELTDTEKREEIEHAFRDRHDEFLDFAERLKKESTPSPPEPAAAGADVKERSLFPRQREVLQTIIELNRGEQTATYKEIASRTGIGRNNIGYFIKILKQRGYVEDRRVKTGRHRVCTALKDAEGNALINGYVCDTDAETGITKCPPGYASGYATSTLFEEI